MLNIDDFSKYIGSVNALPLPRELTHNARVGLWVDVYYCSAVTEVRNFRISSRDCDRTDKIRAILRLINNNNNNKCK